MKLVQWLEDLSQKGEQAFATQETLLFEHFLGDACCCDGSQHAVQQVVSERRNDHFSEAKL